MDTRKRLTYAAATRAKEMYAEVDENGRQIYTQMSIARFLGVSETTIFRALRSYGAYSKVAEPKTKEELERETHASLLKLAATPGMKEHMQPTGKLEEGSGMARLMKEVNSTPETLLKELEELTPVQQRAKDLGL